MAYPNYSRLILESLYNQLFPKAGIPVFKFGLFHFNKLSILLYLGYFLVYDVQRAYIIFKLPQ